MKLFKTTATALILAMSFATQAEEIRVYSVESQQGQQKAESQKLSNPKSAPQQQNKPGVDATALAQTEHNARQKAPPIQKRAGFARANDPDFWIYDAFVTLNQDEDFDGYYSTFTVEFDADTNFVRADVYARLYLSTGDVFEEYATTAVFSINGDSSNDGYVVESRLDSGFPPGDYEVLIELYDAFDDRLVETYDGFNDVDLTLLPLESRNYEDVEPVIVVTTESGGSFGYLMLFVAAVLWSRCRRQCQVV